MSRYVILTNLKNRYNIVYHRQMEDVQQDVLRWISFETKIKELNAEAKEYRDKRDKLGDSLKSSLQVSLETEQLPQFNIDSLNTKLGFHKTTSYESLNYKFLKETLEKYFQNKHESPESLSEDIIQFIKSQRKQQQKISIRIF